MEPSPAVGNLRRRKYPCPVLARHNDCRPHRRAARGGPAGVEPVPSQLFAGSTDVFAAVAHRDTLCRDLLPLFTDTLALVWHLGVLGGAGARLLPPLRGPQLDRNRSRYHGLFFTSRRAFSAKDNASLGNV